MGKKINQVNINHIDPRELSQKETKQIHTMKRSKILTMLLQNAEKETKIVPEEESIVNLEIEILPEFLMGGIKKNNSAESIDALGNTGNKFPTFKTAKLTTRCFFQLRSTDPSIILGFIDIIRLHPCQWNVQHPDFDNKEKRDQSTVIICEKIKKDFNISITPQLARSSILSLIRWFKREYLRSQHIVKQDESKGGRCSRNGYVSAHPLYFNKLMEFIPHKHLKLTSCNDCQRNFITQNQLLIHNHQVHGADKPFQCRYCKRSFLHPSTWKHHENRHTKKHVWKCKLCSRKSSTKSDHNVHMVTHSDIRAFVCDLCGSSYKSSTSLNVHLRTHQAPKLQCPLCNQMFYENYRLKRHLCAHEAETAVKAACNIKLNN
uniref:Zinc finger and SCAN domain-containing protein 5B n=2 Tax=Bactrocera latifrons TaxID=174628 RepID=A0A0K8USA5_BACLA